MSDWPALWAALCSAPRREAACQQGRQEGLYPHYRRGLRMKDSVMETVTSVQENAADILAAAKDINEARAAKEAEAQVEGQEA